MHLDDSAIRLQLNDDSTVDDQVQTVAAVYESGSQSEMDGACRFNDSKDQALAGFHADGAVRQVETTESGGFKPFRRELQQEHYH